jgi:hypothetical protein
MPTLMHWLRLNAVSSSSNLDEQRQCIRRKIREVPMGRTMNQPA